MNFPQHQVVDKGFLWATATRPLIIISRQVCAALSIALVAPGVCAVPTHQPANVGKLGAGPCQTQCPGIATDTNGGAVPGHGAEIGDNLKTLWLDFNCVQMKRLHRLCSGTSHRICDRGSLVKTRKAVARTSELGAPKPIVKASRKVDVFEPLGLRVLSVVKGRRSKEPGLTGICTRSRLKVT